MVIEDPLHCVSVRGDTEIVKGIPDPGIAPREVLFGHLEDKIVKAIT